MNLRTTALVSFALALAILYIAYFTDWFKAKNIHIFSRPSPATGAREFYLDKPYPLTSVEVVFADDAKTNKFPHALWHLVAKNGSTPVDEFSYGGTIPGMAPEVATAKPEPLLPETQYAVLIESGKNLKGHLTFTLH